MLCFNGSRYHGWQRQKNAITVDETLSKAVRKITGLCPEITGCSRTDAGVHALEFVCNFRSDTSIPLSKLPFALNTALPPDIRVLKCGAASDSFHSRFSAVSKTYIYKAYNSKISNPFLENSAYHFPYELDFEKMKKAAAHFIGRHDFSSFMASGGSQKTTERCIHSLNLTKNEDVYLFEITADAFLYNMVRIIAGTLLYVGIGRIKESDIPGIIKSRDRKKSGITAGPMGLYLAKVCYGDGGVLWDE
jgi:tRNA pseudouridine38-40 synthase